MFMIDGDRRIVGDLVAQIARLKALILDLERFANGELPTSVELQAAPLINPYTMTIRTSSCLVGGNAGHPCCKGRAIRTSDLWVLAPQLGWARTFSRLYRLGEPVRETQQ